MFFLINPMIFKNIRSFEKNIEVVVEKTLDKICFLLLLSSFSLGYSV